MEKTHRLVTSSSYPNRIEFAAEVCALDWEQSPQPLSPWVDTATTKPNQPGPFSIFTAIATCSPTTDSALLLTKEAKRKGYVRIVAVFPVGVRTRGARAWKPGVQLNIEAQKDGLFLNQNFKKICLLLILERGREGRETLM